MAKRILIGLAIAVVISVGAALGKSLMSRWLYAVEQDRAMFNATSEMNGSLPLMLDEYTRWESVEWSDEKQELLVRYKLVSDSAHALKAKDYLGGLALEEMACETLAELKNHVRGLVDYPRIYGAYPTLSYTYHGKNGGSVGSMSVETYHCLVREAEALNDLHETILERYRERAEQDRQSGVQVSSETATTEPKRHR